LSDPTVAPALARELGSDSAARAALADLQRSLPIDDAAWISATKTALALDTSGQTDVPRRWLFIAPNNHAIAAFYPLALAYLADLSVDLRLPRAFDYPNSSLTLFVRFLQRAGFARLQTLSSEFRLGSNAKPLSYEGI